MKRIAILGGGMAGLTVAYELTKTPELRAKHQVTVYQMGWRLGGKLASSRNAARDGRNEEHGLHVWLGFYENAFMMMRGVYDQLPKEPTDAFTRWDEAFQGTSFTPIGELYGSTWKHWSVLWPVNADQPGWGKVDLTPWGAVTELLSGIERLVEMLFDHPVVESEPAEPLHTMEHEIAELFEEAVGEVLGALTSVELAKSITRWARAFEGDHDKFSTDHHDGIARALARLVVGIGRPSGVFGPDHPQLRGFFHVAVIGIAMVRGMLDPTNRILATGDLSVVDDRELREFLIDSGGDPDVIRSSDELRAFYDLAFAYEDGVSTRPNMAAGTAIRAIIRIVATCKGHVLYLPQAGFGEAVIAPLYRVLTMNGVRFEFFHRVRRIEPTADGNAILKVHLDRQAKLLPGRKFEPIRYDARSGVWSFSSEPPWTDLVDGEALHAKGFDFESKWRQPPRSEEVVLERGEEFDEVVLAMAHGAFKKLGAEATPCDELYALDPTFRASIDAQGCIPTQSLQLWTLPDLAGLGWTEEKPAMVAAPELLDVWADMTQTIAFEGWKPPVVPKFVAYVCGILYRDPPTTPIYREPSTAWDVPDRAREIVRQTAIDYYSRYTGCFWPRATLPADPNALDYSVLAAPPGVTGVARLDAQWLRANVDPTECCVGSFAGTTKLRLRTNQTRFANLHLAGDWIRTVLDTVCVESAVSGGKAASRSICGEPREIPGEAFLFGRRRLT